MKILINIIAAMHAIIVLLCFYELAESIVCKAYKKIFKKDLKKKSTSCTLDEYDFDFDDEDDLSSSLEKVQLTRESIQELSDYDDIHVMVREKILSAAPASFDAGVTEEEKLAVEYLLASIIDYLRREGLYSEQTFPVARYIVGSIVVASPAENEDDCDDMYCENDRFSCPVETLLSEKSERFGSITNYYADFLKAKNLTSDFGRVVKITFNLLTDLVKSLYCDFFTAAEDFDCDMSEDQLRWAKIDSTRKSYRRKR